MFPIPYLIFINTNMFYIVHVSIVVKRFLLSAGPCLLLPAGPCLFFTGRLSFFYWQAVLLLSASPCLLLPAGPCLLLPAGPCLLLPAGPCFFYRQCFWRINYFFRLSKRFLRQKWTCARQISPFAPFFRLFMNYIQQSFHVMGIMACFRAKGSCTTSNLSQNQGEKS